MATRPVFVPLRGIPDAQPLVISSAVDFDWHAGLSLLQKQRSIASLHAAAIAAGHCRNPLEVSTKSPLPAGRELSAFNLRVRHPDGSESSVESAFQSSKVFERGGPFEDLLYADSRTSKTDGRLSSSGALQSFRYFGEVWPLVPRTAFYDFLYLCALSQKPDLLARTAAHDGFTDIEFNPKRSLNCQARSVALARAALSVPGAWDDLRQLIKRQEALPWPQPGGATAP